MQSPLLNRSEELSMPPPTSNMASPASKLNFDQPNLEKALRDALRSVLEKDGGSDPRTRFYNKFKEEVDEHDDDLQEEHGEDLNTVLIFSGLFSAVTSAFIIDIQSELKPDYQEMNNTLLRLLLDVAVGSIPPGQPISPPPWAGPKPAVRQVQAILYATLCTTLFVAFLATLGKQWLSRYRQTDTHGSVEDRCKDRERKLSGIDKWRFRTVMQFAPLAIQGSLALLSAALARYLWEVDPTVSSVVIGFASFGSILYLAVVVASVLSFDCPFQIPLSSLIRSVIDMIELWQQGHSRQTTPDLAALAERGLTTSTAPLHGLHRRVYFSSLSLCWEWGYGFDARCITRMLVMSTDVDTIRLTMDFVQEVIWDAGIKSVPLEWIYKKLISCFDFTHPHTPILIPTLRDVAYLSAKAFTYIQVQQQCVPGRGGLVYTGNDWRTDTLHTPLCSLGASGDPDLESTLLMVDNAFERNVEIPWDEYRLSPDHHLWFSHLFVYQAWHDPLSKDIPIFVKYSLDPDKSSSDAVIADCLCIINLMLGTPFRLKDFMSRDKSPQMDSMLDQIFLGLSKCFQGPPPTDAGIPEQLRALELITRLSTATVAAKSYELFRTVVESEVVQEHKMGAARLALDAAYRPGLTPAPPVGDPKQILNFLHYHLDPGIEREDCIQVVSSAMRAIDSASNDPTSQPGNWHIEPDAGELLTRFQREIERVKELEGATAVVTLEEAYGRLSAFIDDGNKVHPPAPPTSRSCPIDVRD